MMCGLPMLDAACASCRKRSVISLSRAKSRAQDLDRDLLVDDLVAARGRRSPSRLRRAALDEVAAVQRLAAVGICGVQHRRWLRVVVGRPRLWHRRVGGWPLPLRRSGPAGKHPSDEGIRLPRLDGWEGWNVIGSLRPRFTHQESRFRPMTDLGDVLCASPFRRFGKRSHRYNQPPNDEGHHRPPFSC